MGPNLGKEDAFPRVTFKKVMVFDGDSYQTPELSNWEWHVLGQKRRGYGWCLFRLCHTSLWLHGMSLITGCLALLLWEPRCTLAWSSCLSTTLGRETSSFWHWSRIWQVRTADCSNTWCFLSGTGHRDDIISRGQDFEGGRDPSSQFYLLKVWPMNKIIQDIWGELSDV